MINESSQINHTKLNSNDNYYESWTKENNNEAK